MHLTKMNLLETADEAEKEYEDDDEHSVEDLVAELEVERIQSSKHH